MTIAPGAEREVNYCFQCGRRANKQSANCWYCGSELRRSIRPPRHCPFCGEQVRHGAIKCPHCGEFIDGRPQPAPQAPPAQIVYVIDKDLLRAAADFRLLPGQTVPPEIANRLSARTVQAIETNQPRLIEQPGVRALPAVVDVEAQVSDAQPLPVQRQLPPAQSREVTVRPPERGALARRDETPQHVAGGIGAMLGRALARFGRWLAGETQRTSDDGAVESQARDVYRVCENCGTEILSSDNYCYYCGMQYHLTTADRMREKKARAKHSLLAQYVVAFCLVGAVAADALTILPLDPLVSWILAGAAFLLLLIALFRRRTLLNQAAAIILMVALVWAVFVL